MSAAAGNPGAMLDAVVESLRACDAQPDGVARPAAILWTDPKGEWKAAARLLRERMPELITLGDYDPASRTGPAIWIRCVVDRTLDAPEIPDDRIPVIYMPGVGRQQLRAGEDCPWALQPLVELVYRGAMWLQRSGHDWTVTAFLSSDAALGLDLARDEATREALMRALPEVALAPLSALRGRRLEAGDFDALIASDPVRDLLRWMSDPSRTPERLGAERWAALCSQCRMKLGFDPSRDGDTVAGERTGLGEGAWAEVWARYAEAPRAYPGVPDLLRRAKPGVLGLDRSRWPDENNEAEASLRAALERTPAMPHDAACSRVLELEQEHGPRRGWLWADLGLAPLAKAMAPLALLAERTRTAMGGTTPEDFIEPYTGAGWEADAAAWEALAMAGVADEALLRSVVQALHAPWLDASARAFQEAAERSPLPPKGGQPVVTAEAGMCLLFADGLRYDLAMRLAERLHAAGVRCEMGHRWAALPTVTATAKPAVTPVADAISGGAVPDDFAPTIDSGRPASAAELRKAMARRGHQVMAGDEIHSPAGEDARGWSETGRVDELGHKLGAGLPGALAAELDRLADRVRRLLDAGWSSVRIVTDHGWLYAPNGLQKIDLPKHLTESRWSRCAAIRGESTVGVPTPGWHWNSEQRFATAPGAACFNVSASYSHGGLSVQECLIPDLRVTAGDAGGARASITAVIWRGMRCFIEATAAGGAVSADLRLGSPTGPSVAQRPKPVDSDGTASLVLADDRHEGAELVVVLIGPDGAVLGQRRTRGGATA